MRARSEKFFDHFSQATLFFDSQSAAEQDHIVEALRFELGKVERPHIRERMIGLLGQVSGELAARVADGFGLAAAPARRAAGQPSRARRRRPGALRVARGRKPVERVRRRSAWPTRSKDTVRTRRVVDPRRGRRRRRESLRNVREALLAEGAVPVLVAPRLGPVVDSNGSPHWVEQSLLTGSSVLFDAVYVPGGLGAAALAEERDAIDWVAEAYRHCKPIAASEEGVELLRLANAAADAEGVLATADAATEEFAATFVAAIARHRYWERAGKNRLRARTGDRETRGYGAPSAAADGLESRA